MEKEQCKKQRKNICKDNDFAARDESKHSFGIKFGIQEEYAIEYLEQILEQYASLMGIRPENIAEHIKICGEDRNSCSKTDHDATFWHL